MNMIRISFSLLKYHSVTRSLADPECYDPQPTAEYPLQKYRTRIAIMQYKFFSEAKSALQILCLMLRNFVMHLELDLHLYECDTFAVHTESVAAIESRLDELKRTSGDALNQKGSYAIQISRTNLLERKTCHAKFGSKPSLVMQRPHLYACAKFTVDSPRVKIMNLPDDVVNVQIDVIC